MRCPTCHNTFDQQTICPDCIQVLRPVTITIVSVIYFLIAFFAIINGFIGHFGAFFNAVITGLIAFFLWRMSTFAIGLAMLRAAAGILLSIIGLLTLHSSPLFSTMVNQSPSDAMRLAAQDLYWGSIILNFILGLLLFAKPSRTAFSLLRTSRRRLTRLAKKEVEVTK